MKLAKKNLLLIALLLFFWVSPSFAGDEWVREWERDTLDPSEPIPCNQKEDIGEVYYKFDRIFIYYISYPLYEDQQKPGFPSELKFEHFNNRLLGHLRKNFAPCLKANDGSEKPIVVLPSRRATPKELPPGSWEKQLGEASTDPKSLLIAINVRYRPDRAKHSGVDDFGSLTWAIQRPGVKGWHSLPLIPNRSNTIVFFPGKDELEDSFNSFGRTLRPTRSLTPMEGYIGGKNKIVRDSK